MTRNIWIEAVFLETGEVAPQAGGLTAISRWLSGAIPPETARIVLPHPGGMPARGGCTEDVSRRTHPVWAAIPPGSGRFTPYLPGVSQGSTPG